MRLIWDRSCDKLIAEQSKGVSPDWIERDGEIYHRDGYGRGMDTGLFMPISDPLPRYNEDENLMVYVAKLWRDADPDNRMWRVFPLEEGVLAIIRTVDKEVKDWHYSADSIAAALSMALYMVLSNLPPNGMGPLEETL